MFEAWRHKPWPIPRGTRRLVALFGPEAEERLAFYRHHGYLPHLRHPRTFNEKICHRKLFRPVPGSAILADKYAVRAFVAERGYPEILNELLLVTQDPQEIDFATLPQAFVVKATHGAGWLRLVRNKDETSREELVAQCNRWLNTLYGNLYREFHYNQIKPAIVVERFLVDSRHGIPADYRFFVFHGKCHFIAVDYGADGAFTRTMYSPAWKPQPFSLKLPDGIVEPRPARLDKMLEIAEALAKGFDFMRVDLYSVDDSTIYFGEMTLTPSAGHGRVYPSVKWDFMLGSLW